MNETQLEFELASLIFVFPVAIQYATEKVKVRKNKTDEREE